MPSHAVPTVIHDVVFNRRPRPEYTDDQYEFEVYLILRQELCWDYRHQPGYKELYAEGRSCMERLPMAKLERGMELKDAQLMFEYCLRKLSSISNIGTITDDILDTLRKLTGWFQNEQGRFPRLGRRTLQIRCFALAALIWCYFRMHFWRAHECTLKELRNDLPLGNVAHFAMVCVNYDYLPPIVIRAAGWFASAKTLYDGVDIRWTIPQFAKEKTLWEAWDKYVESQAAKESKQLAKVAKAPHRYRCAADRCGIRAMHKRALRQCGGDCAPDVRPSYCSEECQLKHWLVHRYVCRKNPLDAPIVVWDDDSDWEDVEVYKPSYDDGALSDAAIWRKDIGVELFVDIPTCSRFLPGVVFRLRSRTFSPAFLRSYRDLWQLPKRVRTKKQAVLLPTPETMLDELDALFDSREKMGVLHDKLRERVGLR
ncbi:hypothetical protein K466DRAFT_658870 [Polyporus arcularius HHB13444]|uniref:MYND-type domain-containing protein n=1 Tax=Polyporus arcularius HHB13444 TaxID=1314778 RepID=A0A5C3PTI6_9APHY|nr:hypothetical protein K466DRAFT_658870 [Polyporus arcularius HHB13444]